jgi:integrase/recombinase XerD
MLNMKANTGITKEVTREVKAFKTHLQRLGYSKTSINMLPSCVNNFLEFTTVNTCQATSKHILVYHKHLQERPNKKGSGSLSESYINHHVYALKLFFSWQQERGVVTTNPMSSLSFKTPTSKPREILTQCEVKRLFLVCKSLKEKATLALFYGCGLRRSEGACLNLKDVHFRSNVLYVREGKNGKRRVVPLSSQVKTILKSYVFTERIALDNEQAFIVNERHKRSSGSVYNSTLKAILKQAGITKDITLHCLRHSIATHLLESGLSVEYVRDFLGHKHLESTQIYTRVNQKQLHSMSL